MDGVDEWSSIHEDLLNAISKKFHSYHEYLQLRLVCKQWNLKLLKIPNGNKVPWLLLPIGAKRSWKRTTSIVLYNYLPAKDEFLTQIRSLEEKDIYHLTKPELQNNLIRGFCHGWIIMVLIYEGTIRMFNPFTKVCFDLPPISTLPNVIHIHGKRCTFNFENKVGTLDTILMYEINVWKVITNSAPNINNDFMAVVIYGICKKLAFYKPNDRRWIKFPTSHEHILDVIFFQEEIYAVDKNYRLYEFHIKKTLEFYPVRIYEGTLPPELDPSKLDPNILRYNNYLVGCDNGSLLMLARHVRFTTPTERGKHYETIKFDIYELNKNAKVWKRTYSLGNYLLIVGLNSSIQMLASNCKGNKIYFTDNMLGLHPKDAPWRHDVGIFNLEDGSCKRVLSDVNFFCPPIWILP